MAPLRLVFALSSLFLAEAYWACPTVPLGNGLAGSFPNSTDDYYPAGMKCLITIGVPAGQLVTVHYTLYETDNTLLFFDDTGAYFYSSPTATPVNFHIQIMGNASGRFSFTWTYSKINPAAPVGFSTVADDVGLVQNVYTMQKNSSALVKSYSPVTIFGAAASGNFQYILLYGGEGTSGPFLGSLYTLINLKKSIVYTTAPFTVTVVNVLTNDSRVDGGLLFRTSASIEILDYRFVWQGSSYLYFINIAPLNKKTAALTVYNNINTTNNYMSSLTTDGKVDWLPGSNLPPVAPTFSWTDSFAYNNNILVPGVMNTFVTNSSASFDFNLFDSSDFYVGDVFYFPSQNYRLPNLPQDETVIRYLGYGRPDIVVTVINCYGYFQISRPGSILLTITNGTATISGSAWSKPTGGTDPMYFSYVSTNTSQDTGGLLRVEGVQQGTAPPTTTPKLKDQLFNLLPAIAYVFFKLLS